MIFMAPILTCVFRDSKVLHRPASFVSASYARSFHLISRLPVQVLKEINPDYLIPMHCTGFRTMMAIEREMP
jgi:hypothetical protein